MRYLSELATVIRSKNAGPFELTMDIVFPDYETYLQVKNTNVISEDKICKLYGITPEQLLRLVWFEAAHAVKITLLRNVSSGGKGERDTYGAQHSAPLLSLTFPL